MKKAALFVATLFTLSLGLPSCDKTTTPDPIVDTPSDFSNYEISGDITKNSTVKFVSGKTYLLKGFVYVKSGVTLTIEPGVIIKGDLATKATLFVEPGAKIFAEGTAEKPIVFTSNQPKGSRKSGDWGGVVLLGKAPVNKSPIVVEGENTTQFGGTDAADNSGIMKYVRIEFAGIAFETDKEINGLTFGGVGSGTTIDYIQVSYSGDDSYEWFGGTVNPKHLIAYKGLDDDFDTDNGFSGKVQFGYILRDPAIADQCSCSDSNGFESDNDPTGSEATPKTKAMFANVTMVMGQGTIDAKYRSQFRIRRSSELGAYNTVAIGDWKKGGIELQDVVAQNYIDGKMKYQGLYIANAVKPIVAGDETKLKDAANKNVFATSIPSDWLLPDNYNSISSKPGLLPKSGSALLTGGVTLPSGFESTNYVGAFSTTDWTNGWANWDPQNTDY